MDAFEQNIGQLLIEEKYWVRHFVKIDLTPEDKRTKIYGLVDLLDV